MKTFQGRKIISVTDKITAAVSAPDPLHPVLTSACAIQSEHDVPSRRRGCRTPSLGRRHWQVSRASTAPLLYWQRSLLSDWPRTFVYTITYVTIITIHVGLSVNMLTTELDTTLKRSIFTHGCPQDVKLQDRDETETFHFSNSRPRR